MVPVREDYQDDEALVAALRAGDDGAFDWLLDRYTAPLRRLALTFVSSPAVADEVVQDTWLGVIRGLERFEGRSSLKTWIYRILMNTARTRGVREHRSVPFSSAGGQGSDEPERAFLPDAFQGRDGVRPGWWASPPQPWDPPEHLERAEALALVRHALEGLPANQRIVMSLRDIDGWSSEEVCSELGITQTNQRVLLHRARARVRVALDAELRSAPA
jgi:RNA polymerase sigma-70 factor (ECF subfamily)